MRIKKIFMIFICAVLLGTSLSGCKGKGDSDTKIVLTTGFDKDEVFRIENLSCKLPEVMVFLTNMQNVYENTFGDKIWTASYEGVSLKDSVKDIVLARLAQIKTMNLMAQNQGIELDEKEKKKVKMASEKYYKSLSENEIKKMNIDYDTIEKMYQEYALANKVYDALIADINPEISDDEARTITVQQILFKTYYVDENKNKVAMPEEQKIKVKEKAMEAYEKAVNGEDFSTLISEYSDDQNGTYSFGKGTYDPAFEKAAFELGTDEISDVIETSYGYHIIKCISTFNKEETDVNKQKIVEQRRQEVFDQQYSEFVSTLTRNLNEKLWDNVTLLEDNEISTSNFFEIYKEIKE